MIDDGDDLIVCLHSLSSYFFLLIFFCFFFFFLKKKKEKRKGTRLRAISERIHEGFCFPLSLSFHQLVLQFISIPQALISFLFACRYPYAIFYSCSVLDYT